LALFRKDEFSASDARAIMIDEFHVASHSDHRIRCNIIWYYLCALDLFAEKAGDA
jgi:hypothetical protein